MCHECVTRNHQPSFNPLFKHDKNSKHKLWAGCVKYKIRNEITIQCFTVLLKFATNFNFIMQLSIKSRNLNQSCKFHPERRWEVARFVEKEVHVIL